MVEPLPVIKGGGEPWLWPDGVPVRVDPGVAPRLVNRLCDDMWEGLFDMPHSLNPRPWAIQVVAGVLSALDRAGYEVVRRAD